MRTNEKIQSFITEFNFKPNQTKTEIKELPKILQSDETLIGLLEGQLKKIHNRDINGYGLVIATNKRVIFFRKSFIGTVTQEEVPIGKISSASFRKGLLFSSISIVTSNNEAVVDYCDKNLGKKFIDLVQNMISDIGNSDGINNKHDDHLDKLEKLFSLKEKGIITEDEFNIEKTKLLS